LKVSKKELKGGIVGVSCTIDRLMEEQKFLANLSERGAKLAVFSGAVYKACLVSRGKFVGFHGLGVNAHDVAAVQVIVEEAGGKVTGYNGEKLDYTKPFKGAFVSNGIVHDDLVESLKLI
jgi:fructose-1,6-bisphosphatase/inositol monophosphatase family enzyme